MPLTDDEFISHMQEMLLAESLDLEPEQHTAVCTTLTALRWIKLLCKTENKRLEDISAELVIQKLTETLVQPDAVASAQEILATRMLATRSQRKIDTSTK